MGLGMTPFVDSTPRESTDPGTGRGFKLSVPMRAWYVPSTGVLVAAAMPTMGRDAVMRRIDVLQQRLTKFQERHAMNYSQKDVAKTEKLWNELASLKVQIGGGFSPAMRADAAERLRKLDLMVGLLT